MIMIFSINGDASTDMVIDWLKFYDHPYYRLNAEDLLDKPVRISMNGNEPIRITIGDDDLDPKHFGSAWFRKFYQNQSNPLFVNMNAHFPASHGIFFSRELTRLSDCLLFLFRDKQWLTKPSSIFPGKLQMLLLATECGLCVPPTLVTNRNRALYETAVFAQNPMICKSMHETTFIRNKNKVYMSYTARVPAEDTGLLPERFPPSYFQQEIQKDYEIRSFFCAGKFYSMAIFSQMDDGTSVDFRKYNYIKPNRCIPYRLPAAVEVSLKKLYKLLDLNSGSADLIYGGGKYYFLEINPTGQFGMVDIPCNYGLHKLVAQTLIKNDCNA